MTEYLAITFFIILAAISPGPDFVIVAKNALNSRKAGVYTALGVATSMLFHASYCIMGLTIIISKSILLFNTVKYLGAAYLIYLGIKGLFAKSQQTNNLNQICHNQLTATQAFQQGLLCNVLNPKAVMFFIALFTVVVKPSTPIIVQVSYGIEIAIIHLIWFAGLSVLLSHPKTIGFLKGAQSIITKVMGAALVLLGVRIATLVHEAK